MRGPTKGEEFYDGTALLGDPVHGYISFTAPRAPGEETEKDLIDTRWMQRLRRIYQLQRARWVYPSAEHSRFQHSLGAMHLAGRSAQHLSQSNCVGHALWHISSRNCPAWPWIMPVSFL